MTDPLDPLDPDYRRKLLDTYPDKIRTLLERTWTPHTWRPPAMTYEGAPRVCGYCAADMHDQCNGSAWCEATQEGADCPCGHPTHRTGTP